MGCEAEEGRRKDGSGSKAENQLEEEGVEKGVDKGAGFKGVEGVNEAEVLLGSVPAGKKDSSQQTEAADGWLKLKERKRLLVIGRLGRRGRNGN